jgi:predicted transcriptional regulator of viral defense system
MKYIDYFSKARIVTYQELYSFIEQKENVKKTKKNITSLTKNILTNYIQRKYIKRIKKNLYCAVSLEHGGIIPSRFEIASKLTENSFVGLHSAMEYYGYNNQVFHEVIVYSYQRKFNDFEFDYTLYKYKPSWTDQFVKSENNVRITTLERTIIDLVDQMNSYDEYEELKSNLQLVPTIDGDEILKLLALRNKKVLYNKVGYIIEEHIDNYLLTKDHIKQIHQKITKSKQYMINQKSRLKSYSDKWHLYIFE